MQISALLLLLLSLSFLLLLLLLLCSGVLEALPFCRAARINKDLKQTAGCVRHNFHNFTPQICKISGHYLRQPAPRLPFPSPSPLGPSPLEQAVRFEI